MNKNKILFIWIPRTGGTSLWCGVKQSGVSCQRLIRANQDFDKDAQFITFQHSLLSNAAQIYGLSEGWRNDYWTISIVRNTYERLVSVWQHIRQSSFYKRKNFPKICESFEEFVEFVVSGSVPSLNNGVSLLHQANNQLEWLKEGVDYIEYFENRSYLYNRIQDRVGLRIPRVHMNKTRHKNYRVYYTEKLRKQVAKHFAQEIEAFKFAF